MHMMMDASGAPFSSMDPNGTSEEVLTLIKNNFLNHYEGNRSPFGIYLHASWLILNPTHIKMLVDFFQFAGALPGVVFATNQEIIEWSKNPTDLAGTINRMRCLPNTRVGSDLIPFPEICNG